MRLKADIENELVHLVNVRQKKTVDPELKEGPLSAIRENTEFLDSMQGVFEWLGDLKDKLTSYCGALSKYRKMPGAYSIISRYI